MVIWVKFTIPVHVSSLIPRMLTFTLAISCLTTSNLPWFMDLTFLVPIQYCSLQHRTLLPWPVTSTTGCCFCFGSVSSFFLKLFLHWSPVAYWAPASGGDGIPVELFQILKDDVWKCCTQFASKFGKLSSGHRTGKGQFSFQSQRKAVPKNAQTTVQLHSSNTLVK